MPLANTEILDSRIIKILSSRAQATIGLSQAYSESLNAIHMEHLFLALVDVNSTITMRLLKNVKVDRDRLVKHLSDFDVPDRPDDPRKMQLPVRISAHVAHAVAEAELFRQSRRGNQVRTRDLLVGFLSVSGCTVLNRLSELGISRAEAVRLIAEDERKQRISPEFSDPDQPSVGRPSITRAEIEEIRNILITGSDDQRQELVDKIAERVGSINYRELCEQLIADLNGEFHATRVTFREQNVSEIRSWMISTLGCVSTPADTAALEILRRSLNPEIESDETVRFWSLFAFCNVTREVPQNLISTGDRNGRLGLLAEAIQARKAGHEAPTRLVDALRSGDERLIWSALFVLRFEPFPALIPPICDLLLGNQDPASPLAYNAILALSHPNISDEAARLLQSKLNVRGIVDRVVQALRARQSQKLRRFSGLLERLAPQSVRTGLEEVSRSTDESTAKTARTLLELLGFGLPGSAIPPVAGFNSDSVPVGKNPLSDELGVNQDVKTLCSVLLSREVNPPLAVGLFGDWGTGKSYFMEKMYREVADLAKRAGEAKKSVYHSKVVQIRFNAWHYADSSLWASLVSHIFDALAREVSPAEDPEETKRKLMLQLESAKLVRIEAESEQKRAKAERDSAEKSLRTARDEREEKQLALASLRMPDLIEVLDEEDQKKLKAELQEVMNGLGLPSALNTINELNEVYQQAFTPAGRIQAAFISLWRSVDRRIILILLAVTFLLVPTITFVIEHIMRAPGTAAVNAVIADITVAIGSFVMAFKKNLKTVSDTLTQFESARDKALKVIAAKREEVSEKELALQQELERLRAKEDAAQQRVFAADSKVRELEQKLEEINAGRSLSKFLLERVQAEDYRKQLGIISLIRKDFERLSELLSQGKEGFDQIGRIILYVDDLDRCPADKVVDVLQATHLLLAMPLFVAVVGVDLRWLLHSLGHHYTAFGQSSAPNGTAGNAGPEWATSPQSYLEKIFQIPFTLRPMDSGGYEKLISSLLPPALVFQGQDQISISNAGEDRALTTQAVTEHSGDQQQSSASTQSSTIQQPDAHDDHVPSTTENTARDLNPEALVIKDWERRFATQLFPFIPSPRAAKRFTNIYRILKAPLSMQELQIFEGTSEHPGEFQAAMLMLAVATAHSSQAADLFLDMCVSSKPVGTWKETIQRLISLTPSQQAMLGGVKLGTGLAPFVTWAPRVARFTFEAAKAMAAPVPATQSGDPSSS